MRRLGLVVQALGRLADHGGHDSRTRDEHGVTAGGLGDGRLGSVGHGALGDRRDHVVVRGDQTVFVDGWLTLFPSFETTWSSE